MDNQIAESSILIGLASAVSSFLTFALTKYFEYKAGERKDKSVERVSTIEEYKELAEAHKKEWEATRKDLHDVKNELYKERLERNNIAIGLARALDRIAILEALIKQHAPEVQLNNWNIHDSNASLDTIVDGPSQSR